MGAPFGFLEKIAGVLGKGAQFYLRPVPTLCTYCRSQPRFGGFNPLGVCFGCFEGIPWIRDIHCPVCGRYETCPDCVRRTDPPLLMNRSAVEYDDRMKGLLALYKYRGDERLQHLLGRMLIHAYRKFPEGTGFDLLTYVPLSADRHKERGFNQAEQMARVLAAQVKLPVVPLLKRTRNTEKMSFKTRQERLAGLEGVFAVLPERGQRIRKVYQGKPVRIAVVDDVYTTGTTLNHCAMAIRAAVPEAQVYGLCWAR